MPTSPCRARPSPRSRRGGPRGSCARAPPRESRPPWPWRWPSPSRAGATTWPKPRPPSRRAITGVSAITVIGDFGSIPPAFTASQYCGMRITPWESWPRRLAQHEQRGDPRRVAAGAPIAAKMRVAGRFEPGRVDGWHVATIHDARLGSATPAPRARGPSGAVDTSVRSCTVVKSSKRVPRRRAHESVETARDAGGVPARGAASVSAAGPAGRRGGHRKAARSLRPAGRPAGGAAPVRASACRGSTSSPSSSAPPSSWSRSGTTSRTSGAPRSTSGGAAWRHRRRPGARRRELARGAAGRRRGARHLADRARAAQGRGPGEPALVKHLDQVTAAYGYASIWVFDDHPAARRPVERRPRPRDRGRRGRRRRARSPALHRPGRRRARPANPQHLRARLRRGLGPPPRRRHSRHAARGRAVPAALRGGRLDPHGRDPPLSRGRARRHLPLAAPPRARGAATPSRRSLDAIAAPRQGVRGRARQLRRARRLPRGAGLRRHSPGRADVAGASSSRSTARRRSPSSTAPASSPARRRPSSSSPSPAC